jgi:NADH-quinone oxidoreductase subunit J
MNDLETYLFYISALAAILSALAVVANRKPTYAVLSLTVTMIALSGLFILLKAYFIAVIQILIYAGAILVLFLFVIMLLGIKGSERTKKPQKIQKAVQSVITLAFLGELLIVGFAFQSAKMSGTSLVGTVEAVGEALFGPYLLPFELVSGVLLIGIFGVVNLAQTEGAK